MQNVAKLFLASLFFVTILSCSVHRPVAPVPPISADIPKATIMIVRDSSFYGAALHFWPTLNGQDVAGLLTNQYTAFDLLDGQYRFGVRCHGGWSRSFKHYEIESSIEVKRVYYFLITPHYSFLKDVCAEIEPIDEKEGKERTAGAEYISTGSIAK